MKHNRITEEYNGSAMCGGLISESQNIRDMKKYGVWANMMCFIMPDKEYKQYILLKKKGDKKTADKFFEKYARSQI